jgi:HD-GYP domain-containing protein (c-di-GMP phosphodiesterase class II)
VADVRLAEVLAALSLAGDLGHGRTLEHSLRATYLASHLAASLGLDDRERRDVFYTGLLQAVGCVGNAHAVSTEMGMDDIAFKSEIAIANLGDRSAQFNVIVRHVGSASGALRPVVLARSLTAREASRGFTRTHCEVGALVALRAGLGEGVAGALFGVFERWDGLGMPAGLRGAAIPTAARVLAVGIAADLFHLGGAQGVALSRIREVSGNALDPDFGAAFQDLGKRGPLWDALAAPSLWDDTLALEPMPRLTLDLVALDELALALADFADVKSPHFIGHSRGVAALAQSAARTLRLGAGGIGLIRRAALLHDVGRASVPNTILDKPRALTPGERERVRLHAYYTERVLERAPSLTDCAPIAGAHHERLDGSGYHRGAKASALPVGARLLGAADAFQALTEPRPYRAARTREQAASIVRQEAAAGRLDGEVVEAVVAAAAGTPLRRVHASSTLTERELEVVRLLAAGHSNKQIAGRLQISENTARHHLESLYAKLEVSTRTGAVMQALARGLL